MYLGSTELMQKQQGRKAIVVLTDGEDRGSKETINGVDDIKVLAFHPGNWQQRQRASEVRSGVYAVDLVPPLPGTYYLYLECVSLGLSGSKTRVITLDVKE